ncbi:hypothetical protein SMALA_1396 [Streptomyces malaysiensis subsp. malaysiensis]|nr:hypothetical protein SMALA_1396 [Streptomyces malaysiensis]
MRETPPCRGCSPRSGRPHHRHGKGRRVEWAARLVLPVRRACPDRPVRWSRRDRQVRRGMRVRRRQAPPRRIPPHLVRAYLVPPALPGPTNLPPTPLPSGERRMARNRGGRSGTVHPRARLHCPRGFRRAVLLLPPPLWTRARASYRRPVRGSVRPYRF